MIDDAALERLSGLFAEEREEARAAADRLLGELRAGKDVAFAQRFGKYGLIRELGRGGLGRVWLAWDPELKRLAALKTLTAEGDVGRLMREARMAASLDHPRVAKIYEVGEAHGVSFIAMQYLDGRSLEGMTAAPLEAARWVREAARILHEAHRRGVVHRDVKPGNLMLCGGELWVVDFGLARPSGRELSVAGAAGTPAYMSPEQAAGAAPSPADDVYSLGATLRRLASRPSKSLEAVIARATEAPGRRYPTASALAEDLERVLRGERVRRRFRWRVGHAALLLLALTLAGSMWRSGQVAGRRAASATAAKAQRFDEAERELAAAAAWGADVRAEREALLRARLDVAQQLIGKARGLVEQSRVNLYRKGATLSETFFRDLDGAAASVRRSLDLAEGPEGRLLLGRLAMLQGDYAGARREYARARPAEGRLGQARAYVEEAAEELIAGREEEGGFLLESARRLFEEQPGLSRRLAEGAVESDLVEAWQKVAAGDLEGAVEFATGRTSIAEEFHLVAALARFKLGEPREALRCLTAAVDVRPNYYQAYLWRGLMLGRLGNREYALREVERALEIHPRYARALAARAELRSK